MGFGRDKNERQAGAIDVRLGVRLRLLRGLGKGEWVCPGLSDMDGYRARGGIIKQPGLYRAGGGGWGPGDGTMNNPGSKVRSEEADIG